jgi:DisA bacterial checkpoint controller nucleotide-binding
LPSLLGVAADLPDLIAVEYIQEHFAKLWLSIDAPEVRWGQLFNYMREMAERTYENERVTCNLLICRGEGRGDITGPHIQKILDPLATSMQVFIRINPGLEFVGYEEIPWASISDTEQYKFYPEFLRPIACKLNQDEYSVHLTNRGDLIIMEDGALIAAKRKGRWKVYDGATFKNSIVDAISDTVGGNRPRDYRVGANLFEILFDLSFKRHGALLVYDPHLRVIEHINNKGSLITDDGAHADSAHMMLMDSVRNIPMGNREQSNRKKRLFLELASMDGAVVFTPTRILAFGAMIKTHDNAEYETGARSTAARSAYYWGGCPIKISADGEITIFFKSMGRDGESCQAKLEFL